MKQDPLTAGLQVKTENPRDQMSAEEAARAAEVELQRIFDRWK
jgi:hypothetical protein